MEDVMKRDLTVGDMIFSGETDEEREDGRIIEIDGGRLLIAWRQGVRTWADAADCEPYTP